jgi:hypothetical protein
VKAPHICEHQLIGNVHRMLRKGAADERREDVATATDYKDGIELVFRADLRPSSRALDLHAASA